MKRESSHRRTRAERTAAVREVVDAAVRVAADRAVLVPRLVASTGLSEEGVNLALDEHLEVDPTEAELERLLAGVEPADAVVVILSANVFVGALRAIAMGRAAAERVIVRPSRRDPAFAEALVSALGSPEVVLDSRLDVAAVPEGEIHVYGRDATIAAVRAAAPPRLRVRGHGSGLGVAWVSRDAKFDVVSSALGMDVVAFDQRGCLSPRIVFVDGTERARAFVDALHHELGRLGAAIPRGRLGPEERGESERYIATMTYAADVRIGAAHVVGLARVGMPLVLPPTHRHVHVVPVSSEADVGGLLEGWMGAIVSVGSDEPTRSLGWAPAWARRAALGRMQRPPLDGPVDARVDVR